VRHIKASPSSIERIKKGYKFQFLLEQAVALTTAKAADYSEDVAAESLECNDNSFANLLRCWGPRRSCHKRKI
jgi:hypothetical protein